MNLLLLLLIAATSVNAIVYTTQLTKIISRRVRLMRTGHWTMYVRQMRLVRSLRSFHNLGRANLQVSFAESHRNKCVDRVVVIKAALFLEQMQGHETGPRMR
uniref:Secreted protein n=1 Tax=Ascaris lumbricoides TaxID=6252 RepID=A0A0M3HNV9_ASCLU